MTWEDVTPLLAWGRDIAMGVAAGLVWFVGREWRRLERRIDERFLEVNQRFATIERLLQTLSLEELRKVFLTRERNEDLLRESHGEHDAIWEEIKRIRDRNGK